MKFQAIKRLPGNRCGRNVGPVSTIIIAACLLLAPIRANTEVVDRIVACVDDDIITLSELNSASAPYVNQIKQSQYTLDDERKTLYRVRAEILQKMIDGKLTDQQIKKYNIEVSEEELDKIIANFMKEHNATEEMLLADLERTGMTMEEYRDGARKQVLRTRIVNIAVKSKVVTTRQDAERYYQENPDKFAGEKKYRLRSIVIPVPESANDMEIQTVRQKMDAIYTELQNGASFAEMAKQYSQSPFAKTGGDLGYFEINAMAPDIQESIRGLGNHEFTPILKTDRGFQIFYVEDIAATSGKTLEEALPEITEQLQNEAVDKEYDTWLGNLREKAHIRIID